MQVYFSPNQLDEICEQEDLILEKYKGVIRSFAQNAYKERGVVFRVFLAWKDDISDRIYNIQKTCHSKRVYVVCMLAGFDCGREDR